MILVHLVADNKRFIKTYDDLANAEVMTTIGINTNYEVMIRVNIRNFYIITVNIR